MKAYTDLEQSKKLAEILPIESADMFLALNGTQPVMSNVEMIVKLKEKNLL